MGSNPTGTATIKPPESLCNRWEAGGFVFPAEPRLPTICPQVLAYVPDRGLLQWLQGLRRRGLSRCRGSSLRTRDRACSAGPSRSRRPTRLRSPRCAADRAGRRQQPRDPANQVLPYLCGMRNNNFGHYELLVRGPAESRGINAAIDSWIDAGLDGAPVEDLATLTSFLNRRVTYRIFVLEVTFALAGVVLAAAIAIGVTRGDWLGLITAFALLIVAAFLAVIAAAADKGNARDNARLVRIDYATASAIHQPPLRWWQRLTNL